MKRFLLAIILAAVLFRISSSASIAFDFEGRITESSHAGLAVGSTVTGKFQIDRSQRRNASAPESIALHSAQGKLRFESDVLPSIVFSPILTGLQITNGAAAALSSTDAISIFGAVHGGVEPAGTHFLDYVFFSFHEDSSSFLFPFTLNIINAPPNIAIWLDEPPYLTIHLVGPGDLFNSMAVPWRSISTTPFMQLEGSLFDLSGAVRFGITNIWITPEPTSAMLLLLGMICFISCRHSIRVEL